MNHQGGEEERGSSASRCNVVVTQMYPAEAILEMDESEAWVKEKIQMERDGELPVLPVTLTWEDVVYWLPPKKKAHVIPQKGEGRTVLHEVTGYALPGQILTLMGSTGAGKSTLLDILVGIPKSGKVSGSILMNGVPSKDAGNLFGYVSQDDTLFDTLTVEETLMFYANLKLPFEMRHAQKVERVNRLIQELGLEKCRKTWVGSTLRRGLSGGERKRLAIGCEIVTNPGLILLDEPTTGLDSFSSLGVMVLLDELAAKGHTIVCTLHQPRPAIFELIDQLLLLSQGNVVYFGNTCGAERYFEDIGFSHKPNINPADFAMDVTILQEESSTSLIRERYLELIGGNVMRKRNNNNNNEKGLNDNNNDDDNNNEELNCDDNNEDVKDFQENDGRVPLAEIYKSRMLPSVKEKIKEISSNEAEEISAAEKEHRREKPMYATPWWYQFLLLVKRDFVTTVRNPRVTISQLVITLILSLIVSTIFLNIGNDQEGIQLRAGVLCWIIMAQGFTSEYVMDIFISERPTFLRERTGKMYRTSAYYFSKLVVDFPFELLWPTIFGSIVYFSIGLHGGMGHFMIFLITLWLVVFASASMYFAIATASPNLGVAMAIAPLVNVLFVLGSGFWVTRDKLPGAWKWLYYISFYRFSWANVMRNEFNGLTFTCASETSCIRTGAEALKHYQVSELTTMENYMVLLSIAIICRVFAFVLLLFMYRDKR